MSQPSSDTRQLLISTFLQSFPGEAAQLLTTFPEKVMLEYLGKLSPTSAADIFSRINPEVADKLIPLMPDDLFRQIFLAIDDGDAARLLSRVDRAAIDKKMALLPAALVKELGELMTFPEETAGFLMDPRVMTFRGDETVEEALSQIRGVRRRRILDICIVDEQGRLSGIVSLQRVAVAQLSEHLENLVSEAPVSVQALSPRDEVVELLEKNKLASLPVVDMDNKLLGVIRHDALVTAAQEQASENVQAMFGAGREERALSRVSFAISKRLPWLEINLATAFLASAVVGMFEDTIARITALAIFLPVVAGQSGNTGSQALAVTMRGLALREIRSRHWFQVARKEVAVGFINGVAVALTTATIVYFWESSFGLAVVIGTSMVISMVIAGLSGAVIPILLRAIGQDPAQSSSIILTTVTDVVGFLSFLGLATLLASSLGIG